MIDRRWAQWGFVAAWVLLAALGGGEVGAALDHRSAPVRTVATALVWAGWSLGLVAAMVPRSLSLTVLRVLAPAGLGVALWAGVPGDPAVAGPLVAAVATVLSLLPETGERFVQGSAYGMERRLPLRPPPLLVAGPVPLAWSVLVAGVCAPPLLLAAQQWVAAALVTAVAVPGVAVSARSLHGLSRRWVVFVPAGLVLHDSYTLDSPVLFPRRMVERLAPAPAGTDALDLTAGAPGLALELTLRESLPMVLAPTGWRRRAQGETGRVSRLLITPTRPGRVLTTARERRIRVT